MAIIMRSRQSAFNVGAGDHMVILLGYGHEEDGTVG